MMEGIGCQGWFYLISILLDLEDSLLGIRETDCVHYGVRQLEELQATV